MQLINAIFFIVSLRLERKLMVLLTEQKYHASRGHITLSGSKN